MCEKREIRALREDDDVMTSHGSYISLVDNGRPLPDDGAMQRHGEVESIPELADTTSTGQDSV